VAPAASFTDLAVSPGVLYTYNLITVDGHLNESARTSFTVLTPGGAPREPQLHAEGRGGWGVGFALSYNSQLWWKDGATTWKRGKDVGYGFGWKLLAGALTPVYSDSNTISSYVFTDSTGAEYRLITNTAGVWTSQEAIYVSYDSAANKLLFPDGSFWVLRCTSGSSEADAGTKYPTLMRDTNGNQVILKYLAAIGTEVANSSARIDFIEDVRVQYYINDYRTYRFTYNTDPIPHLTNVTDNIGSRE
ncbi:MAG: hypothetical protein HYR60_04545, partial [Acidobacteria bacterium]|nr:hypothetical protein [Acidobacteriota bacterium]